jgi:hypothetical protein
MHQSQPGEARCLQLSIPNHIQAQFLSYLNLDKLLEGVGLLVACKANSLVKEQLVSDHVAKRVILVLDCDCALVSHFAVILVGDPILNLLAIWLLTSAR